MKPPREKQQRRRSHAAPNQDLPAPAGAFAVDGESALAEYLRFRPKSVLQIYCKPKVRARINAMVHSLGKRTVPMAELPANVANFEHLSVRAFVAVEPLNPADWLARVEVDTPPVILALDHITDPRNLGAIVRSAAFFGLHDIIVPERRQVLLTHASVATAQGGFALTDLVPVVNLGRALDELKEAGYWLLGLDRAGEPMAKLVGEYQKVVLIMGSEDTGMSDGIRKRCDRLVSIGGQPGGLDSLNVSVAAGIALQAFCRVLP